MADLKAIAAQIRRYFDSMVLGIASSHPGGSLDRADFFMVIYFKIIQRNLQFIMDGTHEDLFPLSNGPISPVFYASLAKAGYFEIKELSTFRKIKTRLRTSELH